MRLQTRRNAGESKHGLIGRCSGLSHVPYDCLWHFSFEPVYVGLANISMKAAGVGVAHDQYAVALREIIGDDEFVGIAESIAIDHAADAAQVAFGAGIHNGFVLLAATQFITDAPRDLAQVFGGNLPREICRPTPGAQQYLQQEQGQQRDGNMTLNRADLAPPRLKETR